jgi:hypothetical protein
VCSALSVLQWFHLSAMLKAGLGSTSLLTDQNGDEVDDSALHYFPYGATRAGDPAALPTTQCPVDGVQLHRVTA